MESKKMQIIPAVPRGWMKVPLAARLASTSMSRAKALIVSGVVPVAIDPAGYMWVSTDSLRNGPTNVEPPIQNH
jgi:hypothetical protein